MKRLSAFSNLLVGLAIAAGGCAMPTTYNLPPTERLLHPGPGVDGPGPGSSITGGSNDAGYDARPAADCAVVVLRCKSDGGNAD